MYGIAGHRNRLGAEVIDTTYAVLFKYKQWERGTWRRRVVRVTEGVACVNRYNEVRSGESVLLTGEVVRAKMTRSSRQHWVRCKQLGDVMSVLKLLDMWSPIKTIRVIGYVVRTGIWCDCWLGQWCLFYLDKVRKFPSTEVIRQDH